MATLAGLAVLRWGEAHLALAAVATRGVQTLAVLAQVHVVGALVHVWKTTHAQERPKSAGRPLHETVGLLAVCSVDFLTGAGEAVSVEAFLAGAPVGARRVDAVRVEVAVVVLGGALVLI